MPNKISFKLISIEFYKKKDQVVFYFLNTRLKRVSSMYVDRGDWMRFQKITKVKSTHTHRGKHSITINV